MLSLRPSIRLKIVFSFLVIVSVIIAIFTFTSYFRTINALQMETRKHGITILKTFTQMGTAYIFENDYITFLDNANELIEDSDILLVTVMDITGRVWISTDQHVSGIIKIDEFYQDVINSTKTNYRKTSHNGQKVMEFVNPVTALGKVIYLLKIDISLKTIENQATERIKDILLICIGMIFFSVLLGIYLSKLLTDPLKNLVRGTKEISQGNLNYKINVTSSDEIGILTQSFNKMTDNLKTESYKRQQAEEKIQEARYELEIRVEKRTAELKKQIQKRAADKKNYRKLMEASPVPIAVYDMKGNTIYINPAFTRTFGWTLEELHGKKINYVPEDALPKTLQMIDLIKRGKSYNEFETHRYNKKHEILDVSISFDVWRGQNGVPKGSVVIFHDVTRRKQLEAQLLQSRKMEAMGTLAGGIAHDFNNILSAIFSYSHLAEQHIEHPEQAKCHIGQIVKGAQRAADLVQQILAFSRQTEYKKQPLQLYIMVKETIKLLRSSIPTSIEIKENIVSRAMVTADPSQIHQVIMNLCTNAYHAMREKGGILTVELTQIEMSEQNALPDSNLLSGEFIKLKVKDTGHGMDKKTLEKAFDLYFTTKDVGKGTGFGLALVQAIVEKHDGYVKAYSTPGKGSSFNIYLPITEAKPEHSILEHEKKKPLNKGTEKIMLVDDEEDIRTSTRDFLKGLGYHVTSFPNGVQAFQEFKKDPGRFDLIITDMTMPQMEGDELSARMLNIRKNLPIILCTGYSENFTKTEAIEMGIRKYLQKPVLITKLAALIRDVLDEK
ncbi:hybrid sensor histidine kinase/response regulator [Desulfobacula phenolica]|uniref:histidine kinase n=1 Tax=Desulfobacula phenolica TaxID=90732 RepID=A0A1H2DLV5_9BACT|nr:response regulator [Desulfobacula phenolica]SDT83907.1 PAS/PAC sensor hybrid histidine kinase [Desulfobacula phenolica]